MKKNQIRLINRDLSWLSFNDRVLQEANDPSVPLLERLKFLGIHSSNMDEFFRVRVATLRRLKKINGAKAETILGGYSPQVILKHIQNDIVLQQQKFEACYEHILRELSKCGIYIINEKQLADEQGIFVRKYFDEKVLPALVPILLENTPKFPYLKDRSWYLFVTITKTGKQNKTRHAIVELSSDLLPRFLVLPNNNNYIMLVDDIIRYCLDNLFFNFEYDCINAYAIKITRDAELDIEEDVTKSLVKKVAESVKRRRHALPVRLTYDAAMPLDVLKFLLKKLNFGKDDHPIPSGRYHNFVDFINFPTLYKPELHYTSKSPLIHKLLKPKTSLLSIIKKKDILLNFPYQSYHYIIDILREASVDPKVKTIHITLYRVAKNSKIINILVNAAKNGKQVTAVVELQARFDEEANIKWANKLQEEGVKVIYGVPGLKIHSKLFLISRSEQGKIFNYAQIGTGNFNEETSKLYCDHSLLTADKNITSEVARIFQFYSNNYKPGSYKHLIVSPFYMRKKFLHLINKEIEFARSGKEAGIMIKLNSLTDTELISKLYDASQAGVRIKMIIRSICSLVPGIEGLSENITAISIVDRYLEHARVFVFNNGGNNKVYLSSADWMPRNLDFRSEVAVPVYDKDIQSELKKILELQFADNTKARVLDAGQSNHYVKAKDAPKTRGQETIYEMLS